MALGVGIKKRSGLPNEKDGRFLNEFVLLSSRLEINISPDGQSVVFCVPPVVCQTYLMASCKFF
jgi:hypothetical protein